MVSQSFVIDSSVYDCYAEIVAEEKENSNALALGVEEAENVEEKHEVFLSIKNNVLYAETDSWKIMRLIYAILGYNYTTKTIEKKIEGVLLKANLPIALPSNTDIDPVEFSEIVLEIKTVENLFGRTKRQYERINTLLRGCLAKITNRALTEEDYRRALAAKLKDKGGNISLLTKLEKQQLKAAGRKMNQTLVTYLDLKTCSKKDIKDFSRIFSGCVIATTSPTVQ